MPGIIGPLAQWREMLDGTYELVDVKQMHDVLDELIHQRERDRDG